MTIPDEKLVADVIKLLCYGSAETSKIPGKLIKRTEESLQELEGADVELYRKATGKLIYLSIDHRDLKYMAKVLARRMQKPRKVGVELLKSAGRNLAGRRRVGIVLEQVEGVDLSMCSPAATGRAARTLGRAHQVGL